MIGPSKRTLKNLQGVHPLLIKVIMRAYQLTPIDFGVVEPAVRTQEYQDKLYAQGRTEPGKIVTWTRNSKHIRQPNGFGWAVDLTAFVKGKPDWSEPLYPPIIQACKTAAKELGVQIVCGIDWKRPDYGHIELKGE